MMWCFVRFFPELVAQDPHLIFPAWKDRHLYFDRTYAPMELRTSKSDIRVIRTYTVSRPEAEHLTTGLPLDFSASPVRLWIDLPMSSMDMGSKKSTRYAYELHSSSVKHVRSRSIYESTWRLWQLASSMLMSEYLLSWTVLDLIRLTIQIVVLIRLKISCRLFSPQFLTSELRVGRPWFV